jgi:hypothetical protein
MKIIAVSGLARSGKDTIANKLQQLIIENHPNLKVSRESFASFLKDEINEFVLSKFNKNIYELDGEDKEMLRPLLVAYGFAKRHQTQGRYFVDLLTKKMQNENNDICIISDLRYADKQSDELFWLKNEVDGKLIHVERYSFKDSSENKKIFIKAPNQDEKRNNPILKSVADFKISWPSAKNDEELDAMARKYCEDFYYNNISCFM